MEKDCASFLGSLPLLYAVGAPLVLAVIFSAAFLRRGSGDPVFPLRCRPPWSYALMGFTQFFYNNLGAEGAGIQCTISRPYPSGRCYWPKTSSLDLLLITAVLAASSPACDWEFPACHDRRDGGLAALCAAANLAAGNVFSLAMPYRINLSRIAHRRGVAGQRAAQPAGATGCNRSGSSRLRYWLVRR